MTTICNFRIWKISYLHMRENSAQISFSSHSEICQNSFRRIMVSTTNISLRASPQK